MRLIAFLVLLVVVLMIPGLSAMENEIAGYEVVFNKVYQSLDEASSCITLDYKIMIKKFLESEAFIDIQKKALKVIIVMSISAFEASMTEAKKYDDSSISKKEIDAVMLAGQVAGHGPKLSYIKQMNKYVGILEKTAPESCKLIVDGLRDIRAGLFLDNSKIKDIAHAKYIGTLALYRAYQVLIEALKLEPVFVIPSKL